LTDEFREPNGPFTVLAPTDEAFSQLPDGLLECLIRPENMNVLTYVLEYHIASGYVYSYDIFDGFTVTMLNGEEVTLVEDGDGDVFKINGDTGFLDNDEEASNGVVHVIDSVLVPPGTDVEAFIESCDIEEELDLIDLAEEEGYFNTLLTGVEAAGLTDEFREPNGPFTVLAPTDEAFSQLPDGLLECLIRPENMNVLTYVLEYHIASGYVYSYDIFDGFTVTMLNGEEVTLVEDGDGDVFKINGDTGFLDNDEEASNGVVHVIDSVLVPPGTDVEAFLESCDSEEEGSKGKKGAKKKGAKKGAKKEGGGKKGKKGDHY